MKESVAKVKENRASARQLSRVLLLAVALELLRPAVHLPAPASHSGITRAPHPSGTAAVVAARTLTIAPSPIELIEPLPPATADVALL